MAASSLSLEMAAGALTSSTAAAHSASATLPGVDCATVCSIQALPSGGRSECQSRKSHLSCITHAMTAAGNFTIVA